jgi:hypothetical protein
MNDFLAGVIVALCAVAGLFFLRFWRRTGDRLFAMFAVAFWLLALNRLGLSAAAEEREYHTWLYGVRLLAFLLILVAVLDKNRSRGPVP